MKRFPKRKWTSLAAAGRFIRRSLGNNIDLAKRVELRLKQALADREISSRGCCEELSGTLDIRELEGREWPRARIDWVHSLIVYHGPNRRLNYVITQVQLERKTVLDWFRSRASRDQIPACVVWLKRRREKAGSENKQNVLLPDAMKELPGLTFRDFNEAYRRVYGRKRGRPRKKEQ